MLKKYLSLILIVLLLNMINAGPALARTSAEKRAEFAGKVKAGVARLGVGRAALVEVKLRNKKKVAGYISEATEDHFVVKDLKTDAATTVAYPDVTQIKGNNLSEKTKVALVVGIAAAVGVLIFVIADRQRKH